MIQRPCNTMPEAALQPAISAFCRLSFAWNFNWKILVLQLFKLTHTSSYRCEKIHIAFFRFCARVCVQVCVRAHARECAWMALGVYLRAISLCKQDCANMTLSYTWHSFPGVYSLSFPCFSVLSPSHSLLFFSLCPLSVSPLCLSPCSRLHWNFF